jgi:hypothetical protein
MNDKLMNEKVYFPLSFQHFIPLDIVFQTGIILISFNRAEKAENNMQKKLRNYLKKRF